MSRRRRSKSNRSNSGSNNRRLNGLSDVSTNLGMASGMTGGSFLSSYNTQAFTNNYSLLTLNRIILTYMYTGNGIFQTAIQLPIQDAIGKGIEIESGELDNEDIDKVYEYWEEQGIWSSILDYMTWTRLFGGGALLINTTQDPEKPLNIKGLNRSKLEFYDLDRWQMDTSVASFNDYSDNPMGESEFVYVYGEKIHKSRFLIGKGKKAPHYVSRQLRGWGMSEGERMIRDLNLYLKTQDVTFEIMDEAKIDVYKIDGLAQKMMQPGGTNAITQRIQTANEIKNYINAIVLDSKEDYQQKQMAFSGLAEVMKQNMTGVAAALRMPMTKLFGLSASGFNTGESDLENYNAMIESEIRAQLKPIIRKLLKITMSHLFGYVPTFSFSFPSLREQTPEVEQNVKTQEYNRLVGMYDRGLLTSKEFMDSCRKAGIVQIETATEKGLNENPEPPQPSAVAEKEASFNSLTYSGHKLQGKTKYQSLDISIENKKGSIREGIDVDGKAWKTKFKYPYGYIRGTVGVDGDHVDCYIGSNPDTEMVYIVRQNVPETGKFDEDKVMLGFNSKEEAKKVYLEHYNKDGFFGGMKVIKMDKFKNLLEKRKGKKL